MRIDGGTSIAFILLEFCDGGSVFDLMAKSTDTKLTEKQIIKIIQDVANGIKSMHAMSPPMVHRDIKIENVLYKTPHFKLCDFGSCST